MTESTENLAAESDPRTLVQQLAIREQRWPAYQALDALGSRAIPALVEGLRDDHWDVRRWCLAVLDHNGGPEVRPLVLPLLHDPKSKVRVWAVHTLACDRCMAGENPVDAVPHLIERLWQDDSIRVRRMASAMLSMQQPDERVESALREILERETDRKLRLHAAWGLRVYDEAAVSSSATTGVADPRRR